MGQNADNTGFDPYAYTNGLIGSAGAQPKIDMPPAGTPPKSWWQDATYASAISSSIKGIFDYMNTKEGYNQQKKMQDSSFDFHRGMTNEAIGRASKMPTLKRVTRKQGV